MTKIFTNDISFHEQWFLQYAARKCAKEQEDPAPLDLKIRHTQTVFAIARRIAANVSFTPDQTRACLLAALYHDIARFEQYLQYRTFKDGESCNHGLLGVKILKREARLAEEDAVVRRMVLAAVGLHNRFALPAGLPDKIGRVAHVVRDADKLDILRIMAEHLSGQAPYNPAVVLNLPDEPALCGAAVLKAAVEGRVVAYCELRSVNDFRVLLGTWFFDLHFQSSRRQFIEDGHAAHILTALPDAPPYGTARELLLKRLGGAR